MIDHWSQAIGFQGLAGKVNSGSAYQLIFYKQSYEEQLLRSIT